MMIGFFYRLFNHDKIDRLNQRLKEIDEAMTSMEAELREYKGYKLKYRVAKMYVEDDEALLELFDLARQKERQTSSDQRQALAQQQQLAMASARGAGASSLGMLGMGGLGLR
jgi:hypothetical protein